MPRLIQSGSSVRGVPGIIAGAPAGLSAQVEPDNHLLRTIDTLPLAKWPSWYMAQYDSVIIQPHLKAEVLNSDENQPARVWREGRAKVAGAAQAVHLSEGSAWQSGGAAYYIESTRHPSWLRALDRGLAAV